MCARPQLFWGRPTLFYVLQTFQGKLMLPIKRKILGHARMLERGQQMTIQNLAAETYCYQAVILGRTLRYHTLSSKSGGAAFAATEEPLSVHSAYVLAIINLFYFQKSISMKPILT